MEHRTSFLLDQPPVSQLLDWGQLSSGKSSSQSQMTRHTTDKQLLLYATEIEVIVLASAIAAINN